MTIRRINLWGGPGSGKSATAKKLAGIWSASGYNVDLAAEVVKSWAFLNRECKSFDQLLIFAKQNHAEYLPLSCGVQTVVSESPLMMQAVYARMIDVPFVDELIAIARKFEREYPSINILLDRTGVPYRSVGRYQDADAALRVDERMRDFMDAYVHDYEVVKTVDADSLIDRLSGLLSR
jgi:hypothetical protein